MSQRILAQLPVDGATLSVFNPLDGLLLARVPRSTALDAKEAIERARTCMAGVPEVAERAAWLRRIAARLTENLEETAQIITLEQGKPLGEARTEVSYAASFFVHFAGLAEQMAERSTMLDGVTWRVLPRAAGVAALITPWNFPLAMLAKKMAPALLAGCGVVVKPAESTPLSAFSLCSIARACGVPDGLLHCLAGDPAELGEVFCSHPAVRVLSFTGSTRVGQKLAGQCAPHLKRLSLELGGNAPFLVFEDADLERAADALLANKFRCAGQTCVCANRVLVQESVERRFTDLVVSRVEQLKMGDGLARGTDIGPLINLAGWEKVERHVQQALGAGASRVTSRSAKPPAGDRGCFYPPTVLVGCRDDMELFQEETFGPVVAISSFGTVAEAISRANNTAYGLAAYVFSGDAATLERCVRELEFGHVGLNSGSGPRAEFPFGGMKCSGYGREGGEVGLDEYLEICTVVAA